MADYTRGKIWQYMARRGTWIQRADIVARFGLLPNTASKHLQRLYEGGFIEVDGETTARRYRAITRYGPPGDRRTHEFRAGGTPEGSAKYRKRKATRAVGKAKGKARRVVERAVFALEAYWPTLGVRQT